MNILQLSVRRYDLTRGPLTELWQDCCRITVFCVEKTWRLLVGLCSTAIELWVGYTANKHVYGCYGCYGSLQYLWSTATVCYRCLQIAQGLLMYSQYVEQHFPIFLRVYCNYIQVLNTSQTSGQGQTKQMYTNICASHLYIFQNIWFPNLIYQII